MERKLIGIVKNSDISQLLKGYRDMKEKDEIVDFNIFTITSDLYYRENYHSDILAAFLRYQNPVSARYIFLENFIEMLNISRKEGKRKVLDKYSKPQIDREPHRIDILIRESETMINDVKSKHCIIIENKINDAPDMERQLPRYYEEMDGMDYNIDAIVYLTKYPYVQPDKLGWKPNDIEKIRPLLISVPIKGNGSYLGIELISDWIDVCIKDISDIDIISTLRQYRQLLNKIANKYIGMESQMKLIKEIRNSEPSIFGDLLVFKELLDRLPAAMAEELRMKLRERWNREFKVGGWSDPTFCVITLKDEKTIFIHCNLDVDAPYKVYCADFSNIDHKPEWFSETDFTEELKDFDKNRIKPDEGAKIGFQFGFNEMDSMLKLIEGFVKIYNSQKNE